MTGSPERDVGNEMAVHHVEMQPIDHRFDTTHVFGEPAEVGGQQRGSDLDCHGPESMTSGDLAVIVGEAVQPLPTRHRSSPRRLESDQCEGSFTHRGDRVTFDDRPGARLETSVEWRSRQDLVRVTVEDEGGCGRGSETNRERWTRAATCATTIRVTPSTPAAIRPWWCTGRS